MTVTRENTSAQTKEAGKINFTKTLKSLLELLELEEEDDYGVLRPTDYAFKMAINLLVEAYEMMGDRFPKIAHNSTDELGGIRIGWARENSARELSLFCPSTPDKQAYIYHQINDDSAVEYEVSASNLVSWLEWFKGE
jgi:hypothetical protein